MYPDRKRFCSYFVPLGRNPVDRTAARAFMAVRPLHKRLYEAIEARRNGRSTDDAATKTADGGAKTADDAAPKISNGSTPKPSGDPAPAAQPAT